MRTWIKNIIKQALEECRREAQCIRSKRSPSEFDVHMPVGSQWEDPSYRVWVLREKKAIWMVDSTLTKKAKECIENRTKNRED